jgi:hypothetical protein
MAEIEKTNRRAGSKKRTPNKVARDLRLAAQEYTEEALEILVAIATDKDAPPSARILACNALLDRGLGRPAQATPAEPDDWLSMLLDNHGA